jgi:hypothetical protein
MRAVLCAAALTWVACGVGSHNVVDHNSAGVGTATLQVTGNISAAQQSGAPLISFRVDVADGAGKPVSGATVTVTNHDLGTVTLAEEHPGGGRYVNSVGKFPNGDFTLSVVRDPDKVQNVVIGNPEMATLHAPAAGATVPAGQPLHVTWSSPLVAPTATIDTLNFSADVTDNGAFDIPADHNPANPAQHVTLTRSNQLTIAGALPNSRIQVDFASTTEYVVQ